MKPELIAYNVGTFKKEESAGVSVVAVMLGVAVLATLFAILYV